MRASAVKLDGKEYNAQFTVREDVNGKLFSAE
jgi:hypothetical protein